MALWDANTFGNMLYLNADVDLPPLADGESWTFVAGEIDIGET